MRLEALIQGLGEIVSPTAQATPPAAESVRTPEITHITEDSRTVVPGSLFIARRGLVSDGRAFIEAALGAGAAAVVTDQPLDDLLNSWPAGISLVRVPNAAQAASVIAERFYNHPSSTISMVGVTGTNGKSTVAHLVHRLLRRMSLRSGLIGTIEVDDGCTRATATHTTPPATELSGLLARMVANGCTAAAMEVSSHALHQHRVAGLRYKVGIFTNLSGEHLDYHGTMHDYASAKAMLFAMLPADGLAIIHTPSLPHGAVNDGVSTDTDRTDYAQQMIDACACPVLRCGPNQQASVHILHESLHGQRLSLQGPWGIITAETAMIGGFNAMNTLQAVAAVHHITNCSADDLVQSLHGMTGPTGRLEPMHTAEDGVRVLVDYAHTDDALANAIRSVRTVMETEGQAGQLWVIFGAGGDRDRTKRPRMGRIASLLADQVVVTSDNPRSESPESIIEQILAGVPGDMRRKVRVQPLRDQAITQTLRAASEGDVVLIAGKGHEPDQLISDGKGGIRRIPHDDRVLARSVLEALRKEGSCA